MGMQFDVAALGELLPASVFTPVRTVSDVSAAKRAFAGRAYDIVIVNSPLPDDPGIRFSIDAGAGSETVSGHPGQSVSVANRLANPNSPVGRWK